MTPTVTVFDGCNLVLLCEVAFDSLIIYLPLEYVNNFFAYFCPSCNAGAFLFILILAQLPNILHHIYLVRTYH